MAVEKIKIAYRVCYSLFDKIAFFINEYYQLAIPETKINFKTIWFKSQDKKQGIRPEFKERINWPLHGLFWLSKDLFEKSVEFMDTIDPVAREINNIRNHLEHKYLKIHDYLWSRPGPNDMEVYQGLNDSLAYSISQHEFEQKTLRVIKMVRAGLIYLVFSIHIEERMRRRNSNDNSFVGNLRLDNWEDDWKR